MCLKSLMTQVSLGLICVMVTAATSNVQAQLLKDDFSAPDWESRWEIHDDGTEGAPSQWLLGPAGGLPEGSLGTTSNVLRNGGPSGKDEQAGSYALTLKPGSDNWTDYSLSCDMYHMDNDYAGLFVRYVDELNYFRVWTKQEEVDVGNNTVFGMDKVIGGEWTLFFSQGSAGVAGDGITGFPVPGANIAQRDWFNMTVDVVGDTVTMYMNGDKMESVQDPDLAPGGPIGRGKVALYNSTNPMAYDNVVVGSLDVSPTGRLSILWAHLKANNQP